MGLRWAILCFVLSIVHAQTDDDYYDYDDYSGDGDCECSDIFLEDKNSGKNIGNCLTAVKGKYWCYVSSTSECSDKTPSPRSSGLFYSFEACKSRIDEPFPLKTNQNKRKNKTKKNGKNKNKNKNRKNKQRKNEGRIGRTSRERTK